MKAVLASGPGGQHINKTSSAIQVYHPSSGIRFRVQDSRDQFENKKTALSRLITKLSDKNEKLKRDLEIEKRKKKINNKPEGIKEKILKDKHFQSDKKKSRKLKDLTADN